MIFPPFFGSGRMKKRNLCWLFPYFYILSIIYYKKNNPHFSEKNADQFFWKLIQIKTDIYSIEIADTGQLSIVSWILHPSVSWETTFDFPSSILKTFGHRDSQVPHPMQSSSFTFGVGIVLFKKLIVTLFK